MIDRPARDRLALALRRLASGRMTNDEYEDETDGFVCYRSSQWRCSCGYETTGLPSHVCPECGGTTDLALSEITLFGWTLYDDLRTYRLRGEDAPTREARRAVARATLFLKSDLEYRARPVMRDALHPHRRWEWLLTGAWAAAMLLLVCGAFYRVLALIGGGMLIAMWAGGWLAQVVRRVLRRKAPESTPKLIGPIEDVWPFASATEFESARRRVATQSGADGRSVVGDDHSPRPS